MPLIYPPFEHGVWIIPAVMIGACIGSFLNVVIYRVPLGMSVNKPSRSFCPLCKNQLTMLQNRPDVSWLFLRGKCAHCSAPIPFRYIAVEIVTAACAPASATMEKAWPLPRLARSKPSNNSSSSLSLPTKGVSPLSALTSNLVLMVLAAMAR